MSLKASFGNGGSSTQYALKTGTSGYVGDQYALNGGSASSASPSSGVGVVMPSDPLQVDSVTVPGGLSGTGGSVAVGYDTDNASFVFDVVGSWNSVKNALIQSDSAANVVLKGFVHTDVYLQGKGDSSVYIESAKRGNVETGSGNDTVEISLATNNSGWENTFNVKTGLGSDTITFKAGLADGIAKTTDGHFTTVTIDAGAGNDTVDLSGLNLKSATIIGGTGVNTLTGSNGSDTYVYNALSGKDKATDHITNYDVTKDHLNLNGMTIASHMDFNGDLYLSLSDNHTKIILEGVQASDFFAV